MKYHNSSRVLVESLYQFQGTNHQWLARKDWVNMFRDSLWNEGHLILHLQGDELFFYLNVQDVFGWVFIKKRSVILMHPKSWRLKLSQKTWQLALSFFDELNLGIRILAVATSNWHQGMCTFKVYVWPWYVTMVRDLVSQANLRIKPMEKWSYFTSMSFCISSTLVAVETTTICAFSSPLGLKPPKVGGRLTTET